MIALLVAIVARLKHLAKSGPAWLVFLSALGLSVVGVWAIDTDEPKYALKQASLWLPASLAFCLLCLLPHPRRLGLGAYVFLGFSVLMLAYLFVPGAPLVITVNGATSWLDFKVMRFQPVEMAKVAYVLATAWYLCYRESHRELAGLLPPFFIMLVPQGLILIQPDLGSALLFPPMLFGMLMAAGAKLRHLLSATAIGLVLAGAVVVNTIWMPPSMRLLKPHQQVRIQALYYAWIGDDSMAQSGGYQQARGMTCIAAGGVKGYRDQAPEILRVNNVPEAHTDMIVCVAGLRWGLLGLLGILGLYLGLVGGMLAISARSKDPFVRLSCVGFAALFLAQVVTNIGMCLGLLPITGLTLPFVSYGGSSLLFTWGMVGLVLNFASRPQERMARQSFEFKSR